MTNTEAIDIIQDEAYYLFKDDSPYNRQAFDKAVYALEFLDFLYNHINPNDMEMYRVMFESKATKEELENLLKEKKAELERAEVDIYCDALLSTIKGQCNGLMMNVTEVQ